MPRRHSIKRITGWSGFLAAALFLGLCTVSLSTLLNLDAYRPEIIDLLEKTFHCQAEIGHVRAQIVPSPGLYVSRVALLDPSDARQVLASGGIRIALSWKTMLTGHLEAETIRFTRPRILVHRKVNRTGKTSWTLLTFPQAQRPSRPSPVQNLDIRSGSLEIWDHTTRPAARWIIDEVTGSFQIAEGRGALAGHMPFLGRRSRLDVRYQKNNPFPIEAHLSGLSLTALQTVENASLPALQGTAEATVKARLEPELEVQATISPLLLDRLQGTRLVGTVSFKDNHIRAHVQSSTTTPMAVTVDMDLAKGGWSLKGVAQGYDSTLVRKLYDQTWVNRLAGGGMVAFSAQSGPMWNWSAGGRDFILTESSFLVPEWSAQGNTRNLIVYARIATRQGGQGEVVWEHPAGSTGSPLTVNVTSVTVRQVLEIFHLESKLSAVPATGWNPYGYEPWLIEHADMEAVIHSSGTLDVQDSDIDLVGMHIDLAGSFGLTPTAPPSHIQGDVLHIPLADRIESFAKPPSPLTGVANTDFDLTFPLNASWIEGLSGTLQVNAVNGVLRELKTVYRVMSVLNLSNYFKFRMPQVTAEGIAYQTLSGRITLDRGLASTEDLFLRSPNLNIGVQGPLDLVAKRIDATLRIELFRFLEDVLKNVPITHWIFKKPNKIFLPLVVHVKGPWNDPDVY